MQAVLGSIGIGPKKEIHDLAGRVALVIGGSKGIGFEIAKGFLQDKADKVTLISANPDNGPEAVGKLKNEFNNVEWYRCDVGNLKNVRDVISGFAKMESRLDLLVLSAGINAAPFALNSDGIDRHFGCNWLGQFYATNLLYPLIRKTSDLPNTPPPRIVFVASEAHLAAPNGNKFMSLEEINNDKLGPAELYGRSKLAMILGVRFGIYEKVVKGKDKVDGDVNGNGDRVYVSAVHPGAVNTDMQQQWKEAYPGLFGRVLTNFNLSIGRSPEQGACSALYAATSPEVEAKGWNGEYFTDPVCVPYPTPVANGNVSARNRNSRTDEQRANEVQEQNKPTTDN